LIDDTDDLMSGYDQAFPGLEIAFGEVEIGAAHATGSNLDAHLVRTGIGQRSIYPQQRMSIDWAWGVDSPCLHGRC
jgi:hypothetical protein